MDRGNRSRVTILGVAVVLTALYFVFRSATAESIYPVERTMRFLRRNVVSRVVGAFRGAESRAENMRLRRQVMSLSVLIGDMERLEAENARLRAIVDYKARSPERWIVAGVLSRGGGAVDSGGMIRIDKGALAGVRKNAIVVVPEGLVGKVQSVTSHTAEVMLMTDPRLNASCVFESRGPKVYGIVSGGSEDRIAISHIAGDAGSLSPGTRVLTSGLGGVFPAGYVIGDYVGDGAARPRVDFSSLEDVLVLE